MNPKEPVQFWLLVGASCVALVCAVISLSTRTVQADALLSRPAATTIPSPVLSPTPVVSQPVRSGRNRPADLLHGVASWYGTVFNGRRTASGEVFDMNAMTACHPTLPFGTRVRVMDTSNHKSVIVRITDRGYLYGGRVIDLSYGAAKRLEMTKAGVAPVKIEVLSLGHSSPGE
jgi:rare lipoprotein A